MTQYTIERTNGPKLAFDGQLVADTSGSFDENGQGYAVALFRASDGYVVDIKFRSAKDAEPIEVAEFVEHAEDVEKVLFVFEPLEQLDQTYVDSLSAEARQSLTSELFKLYDKEVRCVLKAAGLGSQQGEPLDANVKTRAAS